MPLDLLDLVGDEPMTDARFPDRWMYDVRIQTLPDPAFRLYVISLAWAVTNRTDGRLDVSHLDLLPCPAPESSRAKLVESGLWDDEGKRYRIVDFATTQTSAAQLAAYERKTFQDRERQARKRAAERDNPRDVAATSKARTGQATTGREVGTPTERPLRADAYDD